MIRRTADPSTFFLSRASTAKGTFHATCQLSMWCVVSIYELTDLDFAFTDRRGRAADLLTSSYHRSFSEHVGVLKVTAIIWCASSHSESLFYHSFTDMSYILLASTRCWRHIVGFAACIPTRPRRQPVRDAENALSRLLAQSSMCNVALLIHNRIDAISRALARRASQSTTCFQYWLFNRASPSSIFWW